MSRISELVALLNTVPAGQLTENAVQTYLNVLNIEIVEKGETLVSAKPTDSTSTKAERLTNLFADITGCSVDILSKLKHITGTDIDYNVTSGTISDGEYAGVSFMICGDHPWTKSIKFS